MLTLRLGDVTKVVGTVLGVAAEDLSLEEDNADADVSVDLSEPDEDWKNRFLGA